ncbi:MAG: amino acid permease [bacterium]|nr:amino acid permease [bacterium]
MDNDGSESELTFFTKLRRKIIGAPRDIRDPGIFHKLALIPLLAWIGLGADGLSSSSYGPEAAFRAIGSHTYLALFLALATAITVFIISFAYMRIIEHFPNGGGGYVVATQILGKKTGVVSGCALIIDYILTISVSIASCSDALFSYLPMEFHKFKLLFSGCLIIMLIILNIRGVKESVTFLAPIFIVFVVTHIILIGYGVFSNIWAIKPIVQQVNSGFRGDLSAIGGLGVFLIFIRAYSLGGGTYTGIEAVSNGLQIMREPKAETGKKTMLYMASSLAITAGGIFICYLLLKVIPCEGKTLNAILADSLFGQWRWGYWLALITIFSEGALLIVGAQAGFIDAPRVMANMSVDSWFPHRFASFSERLTMQNGVLIIGGAALALLIYTHGSISALVVMYSINVFLTFSISQFAMSWFFIKNRKKEANWKRHLSICVIAFILCITILTITVFEKFREGGWLTLVITLFLIVLCYLIKNHYSKVSRGTKKLDVLLSGIADMPSEININNAPTDKRDMTAIQLVSGYNGFGVHSFLSIARSFPGLYKNFVFISIAIVDQDLFKHEEKIEDLKNKVTQSLEKYVELARKFGFPAEYRIGVGTDVVDIASKLCEEVSSEFRRSTVFTGQLVFETENFYHKMLHNETAFSIQRRLQWKGISNVILPIRIKL